MTFQEWCDRHMAPEAEEIDIDLARMGWNAAIEQAVWIIETSGCGGASDDFIREKISKLKA